MTEVSRTVRLKTYTAETGLVYQYYFVGKRGALGEAGTEFVFDVSSDRHVRFSVSVIVPDAVLARWSAAHGRDLAEAEVYAGAKMRLLQAFDALEDLFGQGRRLNVDSAGLEVLLSGLGVE